MNRLAIMQPYLFPYLGYFQLINAVDLFLIYDDVQYIKRGYINRNSIIVNKKPYQFTLPLKHDAQTVLIKDRVFASNFESEVKKIKNALTINYSKAQYFKQTMEILEEIFTFKDHNLADFLTNQLNILVKTFDIKTPLHRSSEIKLNGTYSSTERIINFCKYFDIKEYINAPGGRGLYSPDQFKSQNLKLLFIQPKLLKYPQFSQNFIPAMSIIDVMMHNSQKEIKTFLNDYNLIES